MRGSLSAMYPLKLLPVRLRYTMYAVPTALLLAQFLWSPCEPPEQPLFVEAPHDPDDEGSEVDDRVDAAPPRKRGRPRKDAPPVPTKPRKGKWDSQQPLNNP